MRSIAQVQNLSRNFVVVNVPSLGVIMRLVLDTIESLQNELCQLQTQKDFRNLETLYSITREMNMC